MNDPHPATTPPDSEAALQARLDSGLLEETHYLDIKRLLNSPSKKTNQELARDLAQFAIDSGALVFGVDEGDAETGRPPALHPIELHGLAERVEQIARTAIDPPLAVRCRSITSSQDPAKGYLWVEVPVSITSPHQVDGIYYGRGDKSRMKLNDPDVQRHIQARDATADIAGHDLDAYLARDPIPSDGPKFAQLFVTLTPTSPRPEMLIEFLDAFNVHQQMVNLVDECLLKRDGPDIHPDLNRATQLDRTADGIALRSHLFRPGRTLDREALAEGGRGVELEVSENGAIRLLHTGLSRPRDRADRAVDREPQVLLATAFPGLVRETLNIAAAVAHRAGYRGSWACGVSVTGIADMKVYFPDHGGRLTGERVPADVETYRRTTLASSFELDGDPGPRAVVMRLCGPWLRMLSIQGLPSIERVLNAPPYRVST